MEELCLWPHLYHSLCYWDQVPRPMSFQSLYTTGEHSRIFHLPTPHTLIPAPLPVSCPSLLPLFLSSCSLRPIFLLEGLIPPDWSQFCLPWTSRPLCASLACDFCPAHIHGRLEAALPPPALFERHCVHMPLSLNSESLLSAPLCECLPSPNT